MGKQINSINTINQNNNVNNQISYFKSNNISHFLSILPDGDCFYSSIIASPKSIVYGLSSMSTDDIRLFVADILINIFCKGDQDEYGLTSLSGIYKDADNALYYILDRHGEPIYLTENYINSSVRVNRSWDNYLSDLMPGIIYAIYEIPLIVHTYSDEDDKFYISTDFNFKNEDCIHLFLKGEHFTLGIVDNHLQEYQDNNLYKENILTVEEYISTFSNNYIDCDNVNIDSFVDGEENILSNSHNCEINNTMATKIKFFIVEASTFGFLFTILTESISLPLLSIYHNKHPELSELTRMKINYGTWLGLYASSILISCSIAAIRVIVRNRRINKNRKGFNDIELNNNVQKGSCIDTQLKTEAAKFISKSIHDQSFYLSLSSSQKIIDKFNKYSVNTKIKIVEKTLKSSLLSK